jgi:hypothetical protein
MLALGLLDEANNSVDDILVDDVLYVGLSPVEGEEAHALDCGIILAVPSCTIDDMRDLVKGEPLDILTVLGVTWAMMSSPI